MFFLILLATAALNKKLETLENKVSSLNSEVKEAQDDKKRDGSKSETQIKELTAKVNTLR